MHEVETGQEPPIRQRAAAAAPRRPWQGTRLRVFLHRTRPSEQSDDRIVQLGRAVSERVDAHVVIEQDGPARERLLTAGANVEVLRTATLPAMSGAWPGTAGRPRRCVAAIPHRTDKLPPLIPSNDQHPCRESRILRPAHPDLSDQVPVAVPGGQLVELDLDVAAFGQQLVAGRLLDQPGVPAHRPQRGAQVVPDAAGEVA